MVAGGGGAETQYQSTLAKITGASAPAARGCEIVFYVDGSGKHWSAGSLRPGTCAVVVCTRAYDDSMAFDRAFGGEVITNPMREAFLGAATGTSMEAEISAQIHAVMFALENPLGVKSRCRSQLLSTTRQQRSSR